MPDRPPTARLFEESSARALAALRERAALSLSRVRLVAGAVFCLLSAVLGVLGRDEWRLSFWVLLAYVLIGWGAYEATKRGKWARFTAFTPLADVLFVFSLQWQTLPGAQAPDFTAGWSTGLYALMLCFAGLSLRARVVAATGAGAFAAVTLLQARQGVWWGGIAASLVVLGLAAVMIVLVIRHLEEVLAQLVAGEVAHEQLRRAQSEAETLTHLLVHDMKGPLTGLIGLAELVVSELDGPLRADVKMIEEQGRRLQSMVNDLLEIARLERGILGSAPEPVDLAALLASAAETYRGPAQQVGAQVVARVEPGLTAVLHREMVQRLFDNLILNALDFVPEGGRVEIGASRNGDELLLTVRNTGAPIPADVRARLFRKTPVQGRRSRHNLGLGLYFCSLAAMAHDGRIALEDEPGFGASFVARLPVQARV